MKLNVLNKIYILVFFALVSARVYKIWKYKRWERYYYSAIVCVPEYHPIHIQDISFKLSNDELAPSFHKSVDDVNDFDSKWRRFSSFQKASKPLFLPSSLSLAYVSYREKLFYSATIKLPHKKIQEVFKDAFDTGKTTSLYSYGGNKRGLTFLVGIANNGNIIIWVRGTDYEKEIFRTQLKPQLSEINIRYIDFTKKESIEEYLEEIFKGLSDDTKIKIDNGYEKNANYIDSIRYRKR